MREVLLIARHEYVKFVTRRGTLIGILLLPLIFGLSISVPRLTATPSRPQTIGFTVIDRGGHGYFQLVAENLKQAGEHRTRLALNSYVRQYGDLAAIQRAEPKLLATLEAPYGESLALADYERRGGAKQILAAISSHLAPDAPGFAEPDPRWRLMRPPAQLSNSQPEKFESAAQSYLSGGNRDAGPPLRYVVVVPENFGLAAGQESSVEIWRDASATGNFPAFIAGVFSNELKLQALGRTGVERKKLLLDVGRVAAIRERSAAVPVETGAANSDRLKNLLPGVLAYLLMFSVLSNAGMLLGGVIEEKSNRVVELILSCTSATKFMAGKLLGALGSALTMVCVLVAMATVAAAAFAPGGLSLVSAMGDLPLYQYLAIAVYFITALLIYSSMYLAVGSMMPSIQDAQSFVAPMMVVIILPFFFISAILAAPNGPVASVLSWIPIYTPFVMMFRLPWNPPVMEIVGTSLLIISTTVFMVIQMGRVFAANVLASDRPPTFASVLRKMATRSTEASG